MVQAGEKGEKYYREAAIYTCDYFSLGIQKGLNEKNIQLFPKRKEELFFLPMAKLKGKKKRILSRNANVSQKRKFVRFMCSKKSW